MVEPKEAHEIGSLTYESTSIANIANRFLFAMISDILDEYQLIMIIEWYNKEYLASI